MKKVILGTDEEINLLKLQELEFDDDVLIARSPDMPALNRNDMKNYDLIHSGGGLMKDIGFELLKAVSLNWHYLNPDKSISSNSWKCGSDFVWIKAGLTEIIGGLDFIFKNCDSILSEFAYRVIRYGGKVIYRPNMASVDARTIKIPLSDELNFINKYLGGHYAYLSLMPAFKTYGFNTVLKGWQQFKRGKTKFDSRKINIKSFDSSLKIDVANIKYSAIIPTIHRYPYLKNAIESLLKDKYPPDEILVVDQTPLNERVPDFYDQFDKQRVKVNFLSEPGQSTARNLAIHEAENEVILLFEDDGEAWPNMMEEHLKLISAPGVDVSTGAVLAPWKTKEDIPESICGYHITDVFATGNAMTTKSALLEVNGLDIAFDHGSGADDDLGKRMYLNGAQIIFNPFAIMTHHKAPMGGMRVHGAWWRNKTSLMAEYPPATQLYSIKKYYSPKNWPSLVFAQFMKASKKNSAIEQILLLLMFPYKIWLSNKKAKSLNHP